MLKNISNLGRTLSKMEQQFIQGGKKSCSTHSECGPDSCCSFHCGTCVPRQNNQGLCDGALSL